MKRNTFIILSGLFVFLSLVSLYRHKDATQGTFRNEIWADRAGYYVYLPATFIHGFSSSTFPDSITSTTGNGFRFENKKVVTKYTYGVSLLQLPFFLGAHALSSITGNYPADGFSYYYQKSINIAAVFYLVLGMYLLFLSLKKQFSFTNRIVIATLALLVGGSNLYYYGLGETGMSHIYSFFMFSLVICVFYHRERFKSIWVWHTVLAISCALILLIRPSNLIFVFLPFVWNLGNVNAAPLWYDLRKKPVLLFIWIIAGALIFLPQLLYWKYTSGNYVTYSYGNEGFTHALSPQLVETLFSPHNGLLFYNPIVFTALLGVGLYFRNRNGLIYVFVFAVVCYVTAAWHNYTFGCGAGMRNMVEYMALFAFPLCYLLQHINAIPKPFMRYAAWLAILIPAMVGFKVHYHYYGCYFTEGWDWTQYVQTLTYPLNQ